MRRLKNITAALAVVFCFCALFVACAARDDGLDRGKNYAIVFESNGGNSVASISFAELSEVSTIEPEKDGYIFAGWFVDNETFKTELTLSYIKANLVQKELKAYAKWVTIDECFAFAFTDNTQSTYKISRKENATVPSKLVLPSEYNGKSVVEIGEMAFYNCNTLTSVTIPTSVISIGFLAFYGCDKMTNIAVENGNSNYQSIDGNLYSKDCKTLIQYAIGKTAAEFTIPTNVTNIGNDAFYNCKRLTSIIIPMSVTNIGDLAFYGCSRLSSATIPTSVTSIGSGAFFDCSSLTSITIPASVTSIGDLAFYGCNSITNIVISAGVTSIGNDAFFGCSSLTNITISTSVTSFGERAFYGCANLTSITIPAGVISIGDKAFYACSSLTSVIIPAGVTNIGSRSFEGCSKLTIYAEVASKPDGWNGDWNPDPRPVFWGHKK